MNRRQFLATSGATALTAAATPAFAQPATADARLRAMLDGFFYERLADSPEQATRLGLDTGERAALRGKLSDTSAAGVARDLARSKAQARQLASIDRAAFGVGNGESSGSLAPQVAVTFDFSARRQN